MGLPVGRTVPRDAAKPLPRRTRRLPRRGTPYSTTSHDADAAIEIGERALAVAATGAAPPEVGLVEAALAVAFAEAGNGERAAGLAEQASARLEVGEDRWAIAAASLLRAQVAAFAGDISVVANSTS